MYQTLGFLCLLELSWLNRFANLPRLIFGESGDASLHAAIMESTALIVVWIFVSQFTRHLLVRLHELENYLRVCAWCKKLCGENGEWVDLEEYFSRDLDVKTSHGMCPECKAKWMSQGRTGA